MLGSQAKNYKERLTIIYEDDKICIGYSLSKMTLSSMQNVTLDHWQMLFHN